MIYHIRNPFLCIYNFIFIDLFLNFKIFRKYCVKDVMLKTKLFLEVQFSSKTYIIIATRITVT